MTQRPLRIAIDASRSTFAQPTGTETYARQLIHALITANDSAEAPARLKLYFRDRPPAGLFPASRHVEERLIRLPRLWTHLRFAAELWKTRPHITFVPAHTLPLAFPGRAAVTVHDLGFKHFPQAHPPMQRAYLDRSTRFSQARADLVFADSQATAADLSAFYGTTPAKIRVVYPGLPESKLEVSPKDIAEVRAKFALPPSFFVFVGTMQPRKNISRLVQAFARWQSRAGDAKTALVLAGGKGWLFDEAWLNGNRQVRLTGYVSEAEKAALLAGAIALVFPSLHEGFGFPALEAMQAGTPVIASNTSSLAEIVSANGLLVDPLDVEAIASAMSQIRDNENLRQELIARGTLRARQFTWSAAAEQVLAAFRELGAPT